MTLYSKSIANKSFEEALGDLISHYVETKRASSDEIISAMELQIMALKDEEKPA